MSAVPKITINDHLCSEAEASVVQEALGLLAAVGQGQLSEIGQQLYDEFLARRDVTAEFRRRVTQVRDLMNDAHRILHANEDLRTFFKLPTDAVPIPAVIAYTLFCRINGNTDDLARVHEYLRTQYEASNHS